MFVSKKRFDELRARLDALEIKCDLLDSENKRLKSTIKAQGVKINELGKRTISQTTLAKDAPPSVNDIIDEWLNGEEEKNGD